jgi:mRNA interferase HigB
MHVISRKRLNNFAENYPDTKSGLARWYRIMTRASYASFAELREDFPHADQVDRLTVFNVGGNKCRVIAAIHYNRGKV